MRCYVFLSDEFHSRDLRTINSINFIITHCRLNHTAPGFLDGRTSTCYKTFKMIYISKNKCMVTEGINN